MQRTTGRTAAAIYRRWYPFLAVIITAAAPAGLRAQTPTARAPVVTRVDGGVEIATRICAGCRVVLEEIGRLGSFEGPDALSERAQIAVIGDELIVSDRHARGVISRFTLAGRYIGRYTATGHGPGELRSVQRFRAGGGDTLFVADGAGHIHRFASEAGFIDRIRAPFSVVDFLPVGGNRLLVSAVTLTQPTVGYPLHILDDEGIRSSIGNEQPLVQGAEIAHHRVLAARRRGGVWAAHQMDYVLEAWDLDGRRTRLFTRRPSWFLYWNGVTWLPHTAPPASFVSAIYEDAEERLWAAVWVADSNWKRAPSGRMVNAAEREGPDQEYADRLFDTVIEVIDVDRAVVIAQGRSDRALTNIGPGYFSSYEVDSAGSPVYRIWRARLVRS